MIDPAFSFRQVPEPPADHNIADLALALHTETRLVVELTEALRRQRQGVANDDLVLVDDSVFAANRIMLTLGAARRRRRTLAVDTWSQDLPLHEWKHAYARFMTAALRDAIERLLSAANILEREIAINRTVLSDAIAAGDGLIRAATGAIAQPSTYAAHGPTDIVQAGSLLDRKV